MQLKWKHFPRETTAAWTALYRILLSSINMWRELVISFQFINSISMNKDTYIKQAKYEQYIPVVLSFGHSHTFLQRELPMALLLDLRDPCKIIRRNYFIFSFDWRISKFGFAACFAWLVDWSIFRKSNIDHVITSDFNIIYC